MNEKNTSGGFKMRYLLIGVAYPVLHYAMTLITSVVALLISMSVVEERLGVNASKEIIEEEAQKLYYKYSDLMSLISNILTVAIVVLIFLIIRHIMLSRQKEGLDCSLGSVNGKKYFSIRNVSPSTLVLAAVLAVFLYFFIVLYLSAMSMAFPDLYNSYADASESISASGSVFLNFLALVIGAPLAEEVIYRNMVVSNFEKAGMNSIVAIAISSLIFGLAHGNFIWIIYAAICGFVFGLVYIHTRSIITSFVMHAVFNCVGFLFSRIDTLGLSNTEAATFGVVVMIFALLGIVAIPYLLWNILSPKRKGVIDDKKEDAEQQEAL